MKIAAIGDIHVRERPRVSLREFFQRIASEAEVLLLCGDLTDLGLATEAQLLAEDLASIQIPKLAVPGNHDFHSGQQVEVKKLLGSAGVLFIDEEEFEHKGVGFAGAKGFGGGFDNHMLSSFGEEAIKAFVAASVNEALALEHQLSTLKSEKIVVALHYSPIAATVVGEPTEIYPFLGSSRLAETIDRFNVRAVVHGHAHRGTHEGKTQKGIPVFNVARDVLAAAGKEYLTFEV